MNPEAIIERATARPFIGGSAVKALGDAGWQLVHARYETEMEPPAAGMADMRRDTFKVVVWPERQVLDRTYLTPIWSTKRANSPELMIQKRCQDAWTDLALPLGQKLGVLS
jgi:hypothetical protein